MRGRAASYDKSDLRDDTLLPAELTAQQRRKAQLAAARHALDAADLAVLLEHLGLYQSKETP